MVDDYSSKSFRLLAVAAGVIPNARSMDLLRMAQEDLEACAVGMHLLSLVILTNSIREDSKATIHQVQNE